MGTVERIDKSTFERFADWMTAAIDVHATLRRERDEACEAVAELQRAWAQQVPIEQAKGIVALLAGSDPDTALEALRHYARTHGRTVEAVAADVVDRRGEVLGSIFRLG